MAKAKPTPKKPAAKTKATAKAPAVKRAMDADFRQPSPNMVMPPDIIHKLINDFAQLRNTVEEFSAHLRSLDVKRLNGVGIKTQGFIERSYSLAVDNTDFLPHWLPVEKFKKDLDQFLGLRNLVDMSDQVKEMLWNMLMISADMVDGDARAFYAQVQDAAQRRVDTAESLYAELKPHFEGRGKHKTGEKTQKQVLRDSNALLKGKKDGKIVIENISPKTIGGSRRVVNETFTDDIQHKDTEEGSISE